MKFGVRLIDSIDHCVKNLVVMIPSDIDFTEFQSAIDRNEQIYNTTIIRSPFRLFGVSEGWNTGLQTFPRSAWFLICNYDVEFEPGQLREISSRFWQDIGILPNTTSKYQFALVNWNNMGPGGFNLFAISRLLVRKIGYFDENFYPAFHEDRDYEQRIMIHYKGRRRLIHTYTDIKLWHGVHTYDYSTGTRYLRTV
jgi:hypothetical protein